MMTAASGPDGGFAEYVVAGAILTTTGVVLLVLARAAPSASRMEAICFFLGITLLLVGLSDLGPAALSSVSP